MGEITVPDTKEGDVTVPKPINDQDTAEHELTLEEKKYRDRMAQKLKRFLFTYDENALYVSGDPDKYDRFNVKNLPSLFKFLATKTKRTILRVIEEANESSYLPDRKSIFAVLSIILKQNNLSDNYRSDVYKTVANVIKSDEDLFLLVRYTCNLPGGKKMPSGMQKVVINYYNSTDPIALAKIIAKNRGYYGWSHKDLIMLSHWKPVSRAYEIIIQIVLYGQRKDDPENAECEDAMDILELLLLSKVVRSSTDEEFVADNLSILNFSFLQVPTCLNKSSVIWMKLIPAMPMQELLSFLPRLYKTGLLGPNTPTHKLILDKFKDSSAIKYSNIQPAEVLIALRTYEKGGKPKDPHLIQYLQAREDAKSEEDANYMKKPVSAANEPIKTTAIISAIYKLLAASYENIVPLKKNIFITIDSGSRMLESTCLTSRNMTCLDAAAIVALSFLKSEKNVTIAIFNKDTVSVLPIDKNINLAGFIKKIEESPDTEIIVPSAPITHALNDKMHVDVFINMTCSLNGIVIPKEMRGKNKDKPMDKLKAYNTELSKHARIISCSFGTHNNTVAQGLPFGLDINGFDEKVIKIMHAFIKNCFH